MSGYVLACYGITIASLVTYSAWVITRVRQVNKRGSKST
jgi:hypothetical protein